MAGVCCCVVPLSRVALVFFTVFPVFGLDLAHRIVQSFPLALRSLVLCRSFPLCVGVRGSARAALRARTLSPNTIVFFVVCLSSLLFSSHLAFPLPAFLSFGMAVCDSPCVGVPSWHDGYG